MTSNAPTLFVLFCILIPSLADAQVRVYSNPNQRGPFRDFRQGRFDLNGAAGIGNNTAASVSVDRGFWLHACDGPMQDPAECLAFGPGSHSLGAMTNRVSSVFVQANRPAAQGAYGDLIVAPTVAIFAAQGPTGEILFYKLGFGNVYVYDPRDGSITSFGKPPYEIVCAGIALEATTGNVILAGGGKDSFPRSAIWNWDTYSFENLNDLAFPSYYGTNVALPDGRSAHFLGTPNRKVNGKNQSNHPEIHRPGSAGWVQLTNMDITGMWRDELYSSNWFPTLHVVKNGHLMHTGPIPNIHTVDIDSRRLISHGRLAGRSDHRHWSISIMYDALGKMLVTGGTPGPPRFRTYKTAVVVDATNPNMPTSTSTQPMFAPRAFHCAVVLPTGQVLVTGGSSIGDNTSGRRPVYLAEQWNPETGAWTKMASSVSKRHYHSSSLLMTDGTVWTAGGQATVDADGNQDSISFFKPNYLFTSTGAAAARLVIMSGPSRLKIGGPWATMRVTRGRRGVREITAVRMGTSNHQMNMDTRFLSLTKNGLAEDLDNGKHRIRAHSNSNVMVPGYWMVFVIDTRGVPSEAKVVKIVR